MIYDPNYSPDQVAVTPDGKKVYVTDEGSYDVSGNVSVIHSHKSGYSHSDCRG
jgi:DNA-binding beta-propeller fold protein YncE